MDIRALLKNMDVREVRGELRGDVSAVCYDSRQCKADSLFIAVSGLKLDGHDYIADAVSRGARFIVHENACPQDGPVCIRVADSRRALGIIGRNFYRDPSSHLCLIGIVGTNGKTTVTYLIESILSAASFSVGVLGTVNYRFGTQVLPAPNTTPESIDFQRILREMADGGVTHVAAEVTSHAIDLHRVDDCTFALGIFTNLSQDHLDYHGTMEGYFQAKQRFFTEILPRSGPQRPIIVNGDDPWGRRLLQETANIAPLVTFGLADGNDVTASHVNLSPDGIQAVLHSPWGSFPVTSSLTGSFNLSNILAAATASLALGVLPEIVAAGILHLDRVPGRLEKVSGSGSGEPQVFVDYAHTEDALRKALENLQEYKQGRIITVFGCGGDRDRGKRPLMGRAAAALSELVVVTSDNPRTEDPLAIIADIERGLQADGIRKFSPEELPAGTASHGYTVIPDRREAIRAAVSAADPSDTVLIAGKGHEDYQIIGTTRIPFDDRSTAREFLDRKRSGKGTPP